MAINRNAYKSLVESVNKAVLAEAQWASGEALTSQLNRMQNNGPSATTGASKGGVRSRNNPLSNRRPGTSGTSSGTSKPAQNASKAPSVGVAGVGAMSEDEEWDVLDEILAEGLELYGEDGLEEILADFAETGEMSEELADLIDAAEQLDELSNKTYKSYIRKSTKDIKHRSFKGGLDASSVDPSGDFTVGSPDEDDERENRKVNRRIKGIGAASKALGRNAKNAMKAAKDIKRKSIYRGFYRGED